MAAYAALVSLTQTLESVLLHEDLHTAPQEKQLMQSLHEHTLFLQSFLDDFPRKASDFEERIRDVAHQTDDEIQCFMSEQIQSYYASRKVVINFERLYHELLKITDEKIDPLVKQVTMIVKDSKTRVEEEELVRADSLVSSSSLSRSIASSTGKEVVVGLDDDLMVIKDGLCGESSKLEVIPIVGMGGIGKTTLAKTVYTDPLIMERFHVRAWATVSQNYNPREVFKSILACVRGSNEEECSVREEERLGEYAYKALKGRKYVIVIDDVWSTDAWDLIKKILPDDNNGSRIILTTRLADVATYADSFNPRVHEMKVLDEDRTWRLLEERIGCFPRELEGIGKIIARRCRGLPLAAVVVAGILSTIDQTLASWQTIADNLKKVVASANGDQIDKILSLSYDHLPHRLRPCFLYMAGFPEDYKISVSQLIKLWIAEGFFKPNRSKSFEEQAEGYLNGLVKRSLVFTTHKKSNGKMKFCGMHDLLLDMSIRKAEEEKFLIHATKEIHPETLKDHRRVSSSSYRLKFHGSSFRTILYFFDAFELPYLIRGFRMLKIIHALETNFSRFPYELLNLFHLKYLALKLDYIGDYDSDECIDYEYNFNYHIDLPGEIERLQKLQSLIIEPCVVLPISVFRMSELRHIISKKIVFPSQLPDRRRSIENLQTLGCVLNFKCSKKFLHISPNIKKLRMFYHRQTGEVCWDKYKLQNLVHMHLLENLKLTVSRQCLQYPILSESNIAFPAALKKLTLDHTALRWEHVGVVIGSLRNLEVLKLKDFACRGSMWETSEGEFLRLKYLSIDATSLETWITESSSHFPCLERLLLRSCKKLRGIPEEIGDIPTLELIDVDGRDRNVVESAKRIKEEQTSMGNDALQVRFSDHEWRPFD